MALARFLNLPVSFFENADAAASEPQDEIRTPRDQERMEQSQLWHPQTSIRLGDPRHPIAEWANRVKVGGRLALDGVLYTYKEFQSYYRWPQRVTSEWGGAWYLAKYDYCNLQDRDQEALHIFLHRLLQTKWLLKKWRIVLTNDRFVDVLDDRIRNMIARFLTEDEAMAHAISSTTPVLISCSHSDPAFTFAMY